VWHNELGGLTYRIGSRFIKWNPRRTGVDLELERIRLTWLDGRHPAPEVIDWGSDDEAQWLVTKALEGEHAGGDRWRARRAEAIAAIAYGLRKLHSVEIDGFPLEWVEHSWVGATPAELGPRPAIDGPVLVHGDACAPNTPINLGGQWTGNVDFGDLSVGDRWADLAIASLSLDWNFGEGHQDEFFDAYGVEPAPVRIEWYRKLWHLES
jgi:kanamycin kinase